MSIQPISSAALSTVCGGASFGELACRSVGATAGALAGVGLGTIGAGGPASTAVNAVKLARRTGMAVNLAAGISQATTGHKDPPGVVGTALGVADTAGALASFVPGPVGAAGSAWTLGRAGSDLGAWACGY